MLSKLIRQCKPFRCQITQSFVRTSTSNLVKTDEKIKFDSVSTVYDYKSTGELFRGWFVFKLCSYSSLINHLTRVKECLSLTLIGFSNDFSYLQFHEQFLVNDYSNT